LIEEASPPTQYRLSGRQFYRSKDPTNSVKVLKEKNAAKVKKPLKTQTTQKGWNVVVKAQMFKTKTKAVFQHSGSRSKKTHNSQQLGALVAVVEKLQRAQNNVARAICRLDRYPSLFTGCLSNTTNSASTEGGQKCVITWRSRATLNWN